LLCVLGGDKILLIGGKKISLTIKKGENQKFEYIDEK